MNNGDQPFNYAYESYVPEESKNSALATISMVLGICSIVLCCCCAGVTCGIVAVVLAAVDRSEKGKFSPFATAGLACGIIGIVFGVVISALSIVYSDILMEIAADPSYFKFNIQ